MQMGSLNRDMIACFGDSITVGRPGTSYFRYLKYQRNYVNFGLGGDTLLGVSKRIDDFLTKFSCDKFIIEIGCNDILLPHLRNRSKRWTKIVEKLIARGSVPLSSVYDFADQYEKLIYNLSDKKVIIVSIPCIGENLESDLNKKVEKYNESIKNLCKKYGITYIDFNRWQRDVINKNPKSDYFISKNPFNMMLDSFTTTYVGLSSWISKRRKLVVTVDGVHLNKEGAKGLAFLIEKNSLQLGNL
jgi:lysophospholipase L1-like esterase